MKKLLKSCLIILAFIPFVSGIVLANEKNISLLDLPTTEKVYNVVFNGGPTLQLKPGETIPNPDYTGDVPSGKQFSGWINDTYQVGQTLPNLDSASLTINFEPTFSDVVVPQPPVAQPEYRVRYETEHNDVTMIHLSEIDGDVLGLANAKVYKITDTYLNGQLVSAGERVKVPAEVVLNQIGANYGEKYPVTYKPVDADNLISFVCNFMPVPNTTTISEDRALGINISNGNITISNEEARNIRTANDLISLNQVTAFNTSTIEQVAVVNNTDLSSINSGKAGTYTIEYGILKNRTPFIATATITVQPGIEVESTPIEGAVDVSQVAQNTGNNKTNTSMSEKTNTQGVRTGVSSSTVLVASMLLVSVFGLVLLYNRRK